MKKYLPLFAVIVLASCASNSMPPMTYGDAYTACMASKRDENQCHAEAQNYCLNNACIWG